ncbi:MAG: DUF3575 domain-containing protein [Bacteroidales bacterium]|nr:DUF3575 domain-containing protein [Bacteroidales bacterium]
MRKRLFTLLTALTLCVSASAQKWSVQTNALDWLALGTANAEVGMSVSRHFSIMAGGRYNPWELKTGDPEVIVRNQQRTAYIGVRYWTWYVNSGFWTGIKAQYLDFSNTGIWREALKEGREGIGGGLSLGYTYMLGKHFNIEASAGAWAGKFKDYHFYSSPEKKHVREEGSKTCLYPDNPAISFVYVF